MENPQGATQGEGLPLIHRSGAYVNPTAKAVGANAQGVKEMCLKPIYIVIQEGTRADGKKSTHVVEKYRRQTITYVDADGREQTKTKLVSRTDDDNCVMVRCGKCKECLMTRAKEWAIRAELEERHSKVSYFLTLTYNDASVPPDGKLNKRDYQLFLKKLRQKDGDGIKYLGAGEYGGRTKRPHYHFLLFHVQPTELIAWKMRGENMVYIAPEYEKMWGKGYCKVGMVSAKSAAYVARYTNKKAGGNGEEFITMSRRPGLAHQWYLENGDDAWTRDCIEIKGGKTARPPRYFEKLSEQITSEWYGENIAELIKSKKERRRKSAIEKTKWRDVHDKHHYEVKKQITSEASKQLIRILDYGYEE